MGIRSPTNHRHRCSRCLMPANYPGIVFNDENVCNYCIEYEKKRQRASTFLQNRYRAWMEKVIERTKKANKGNYDCLLCLSGGKDSTFLLYLLVEEYGLNVLAYTFDNEFLGEAVKRNIERILSKINVDHIWYRPGEDLWIKLYSAAFQDIFTGKSSNPCVEHICTQCSRVTGLSANKMAVEKNIPLLVWGLSPHQLWIPKIVLPKYGVVLSYLVNKISYNLGIRQPFSCKLEQEKRELRIPFWNLRKFPYLVTPYYALGYDVPKISNTINKLGLIAPGDDHPLHTNCLLNFVMTDLDYRRFGYNSRLQEFSQLVREGNLERQEWLALWEEIDTQIEDGTWERQKIEYVLDRLGLTNEYRDYVSRLNLTL